MFALVNLPSPAEKGDRRRPVDEEDIIQPNKKQKKYFLKTKYIFFGGKNNGRQIYGRT